MAIAKAIGLNRTTVARAIAATMMRNTWMRNIDQSNSEKAIRITPACFDKTFLIGIGWFYRRRISNIGTAVVARTIIATSEEDKENECIL